MEEQRRELNDAERDDLDGLIDMARAIVMERGLRVGADELPTPAQLDHCFEAWAAEPAETRVHTNNVVSAFGAVLGAHLCGRLGLRWILVSDEYGTELAVNGDPDDILLFPLDAIAKRLDRGEVRFFEEFLEGIVERVRQIREG